MKKTIYLDNAATSFPKPERVYATLRQHLEQEGACPGRGSYAMARCADAVVLKARHLIAKLIGTNDSTRVAFTLNATDAINMAIKGVLNPGDHVVTTVMEHNSVSRPINRLEKEGVVTVTRVSASPEGILNPEDIRRALRKETKLVALVHGSNVNGALEPAEAIGSIVREHGAYFLLDASQTLGAVPLDVTKAAVDLLAFPGHKALMGPPGTGALYVDPRVKIRPWREGGTGVLSDEPFQPEQFPHLLESGSPNTLGLAGLCESLEFIREQGVEKIRRHELEITDRLIKGISKHGCLRVIGPKRLEDRIAVIALTLEDCSPAAVAEYLDREHGIAVRSGLQCAPGAHKILGTFPQGTVRISPGFFTTPQEVDVCVDALVQASRAVCGTGSEVRGCV